MNDNGKAILESLLLKQTVTKYLAHEKEKEQKKSDGIVRWIWSSSEMSLLPNLIHNL